MIQKLWDEGKCPLISGVVYKNDVIRELILIRDEAYKPVRVETGIKTDVASFLKPDPEMITNLLGSAHLEIPEKNMLITVGEGSWGGDGFISVESLDTEKLQYLIFFDYSNPFVSITLGGKDKERMIVTSNLDEVWTIPINDPENISVAPSPYR